jgi:hypothetical protein
MTTEYERIDKGVRYIDLYYPRSGDVQTIDIDLVDVRANDGLRIRYDFDRDGWVIMQPKRVLQDTGPGTAEIETWHEVFFAQAWALEDETEGQADERT